MYLYVCLIYYIFLVVGKFFGLFKNFPYLLIKLEIIISLRLVQRWLLYVVTLSRKFRLN